MWWRSGVASKGLDTVDPSSIVQVDPSSMDLIAPSSIAVVVWRQALAMVVPSMMHYLWVQLVLGLDLLSSSAGGP
jgi:hypothetical protein